MTYRKDIQILRGISVMLVVLFHFGLGGFKSGFMGVDIFFVISGYLMAILYDPDHIWGFFVKRSKRLLPAYFITVLAVLLYSMVFVSPNEFGSVSQQAFYASVFIPNIGYWLRDTYFNKDFFNPLLHLWSLGVEIQFYLILPILYFVFKKIKGSYIVVLLGSLILCFFVVGISEKTSFFMMPLRLWEFLIGYGIAIKFPKLASPERPLFRWLGFVCMLALFCIPIIHIDGEVESFIYGHPGIFALVVCLLTAGVLAAGLPSVIESSGIATVFEKLGEYSYSIYLVHFPIIVFFFYQPFSGTITESTSIWQIVVMSLLILVFTLSMHLFVENPFRVNGKTYLLVGSSALLIFILGPVGIKLQEQAYPPRELLVFKAWGDRSEYRCGKIKRIMDPLGVSCNITDKITQPAYHILLVGNSHADSIKTTFASVAEENNVSVRLIVGNSPLIDGETAEQLVNESISKHIETMVLHYSPGSIDSTAVHKLINLANEHHIYVAFIMPVPTWSDNVPKMLWKNMEFGEPLPIQTRKDYETRNQKLHEGLRQIAGNNFAIYEVADIFCQEDCQMLDEEGKPFYADGGHLTLTGSEILRSRFQEIISDLVRNH